VKLMVFDIIHGNYYDSYVDIHDGIIYLDPINMDIKEPGED
jgi:hypothetical protein